MSNRSSTIHLFGRYPVVAQSNAFNTFDNIHGSEIWHETDRSMDGIFDVIIQSLDQNNILAFHLQQIPIEQNEQNSLIKILDIKEFNLLENGNARKTVLEHIEKIISTSNKLFAIRPLIDWEINVLNWQIETLEDNSKKNIYIFSTSGLAKVNTILIEKLKFENNKKTSPEWLEENELYHLDYYRDLARKWAGSAVSDSDIAYNIYNKTRNIMRYDATITEIIEFIWADYLIINTLGYMGICDEWAVIQITMLRALGIPAVMKFLVCEQNGKTVGHACVEWSDNGTWRHLDALWNSFDDSTVYRRAGLKKITVMDASTPRDFFYTGNYGSVYDSDGDDKLLHYKDFIITPDYPGNPRDGYSYS